MIIMDEKKEKFEETDYIGILKEAQRQVPNIILPNMGLLKNDNKIQINGAEIIGKKESKENRHVE